MPELYVLTFVAGFVAACGAIWGLDAYLKTGFAWSRKPNGETNA